MTSAVAAQPELMMNLRQSFSTALKLGLCSPNNNQ
eukprot:CAMPEP_0174290344 /NCGR_PEP_ID=MMETSP0809-20121228/28468_1 /TAXON_ID=73025 ORGANISM="Eutreptiella gymnastica-like, Strain CCMP1594" /NCGR_SAMPLE_ID=MMETSP0809 /ASSEMBLY_ACC=CAM_ASM_000658 /LENGTH=34 /DNA_ID= /DNA_START= /DNA_END= /DNA_ORIENTATION=